MQRAQNILCTRSSVSMSIYQTCNERNNILIRNNSYKKIQFKSIPELKYGRCLLPRKYDAHSNLDTMIIFFNV